MRAAAFFALSPLVVGCAVPADGDGERSAESNYPPGYVVSRECQSDGPVEVCALNRSSGVPQLEVKYRGYLLTEQWGRISAWVRLNGRDGTFRTTNRDYTESITLGALRDVYMCRIPDATGATTSGPYPVCPDATPQPGGGMRWNSSPPPAAESALFFYARNGYVTNDWDVDVAFVSDDGRWDSRFGANYHFTFSYR